MPDIGYSRIGALSFVLFTEHDMGFAVDIRINLSSNRNMPHAFLTLSQGFTYIEDIRRSVVNTSARATTTKPTENAR